MPAPINTTIGRALLGGARLPLGTYNFNRAYLANWKAALNNARNGVSNGVILSLGDSTTVGIGTVVSGVNTKTGSVSTQLAGLLTTAGVPASAQNCFCDFGYTTHAPTYDPRLSIGSWTFSTGVKAFAGQTYQAGSGANGTLSFTPTIQTDTVDIYYVTNTSLGSFNANINGGTNTLQSTAAAAGYRKLTLTGSLGMNVYNMAWASGGSVFIVGFNAYNSAVKQISVLNMGQGGATVAGIQAVWHSVASLLAIFAPALTTIQIGINDWMALTNGAAFSASLQSLISAAKSISDVLLIAPIQSSSATIPYATQQPYLDNYPTDAISNNCVLLNVNQRWGGFPGGNASGFYYSDGIHGNTSGYGDEASALSKILLAA